MQAVHRFFLGNGDKNVSRETCQLTMDNGQLTICPGTGNVSLGRAEKIKQCGPPGADRGDILIMGCIYRSMQRQTTKKFAGDRSADCVRTGLTNRDSLVCLTCGHLRWSNRHTKKQGVLIPETIVHCQLSIANCQLSIVNWRPSSIALFHVKHAPEPGGEYGWSTKSLRPGPPGCTGRPPPPNA